MKTLRKLEKQIFTLITALLFMVIMVSLNTFGYKHYAMDESKFWFYILTSLMVISGMLVYYRIYEKFVIRVLERPMKIVLVVIAVFFALFLFGMIAIIYTDSFAILISKDFYFGFFNGQKRWMFDLLVILVFPTMVAWIGKNFKKEYTVGNQLVAAISIIVLNLIGFLFFDPLGDAWLIDMALLNVVTVSTMILDSSEVHQNADAEEKVKWICAYVFFWTGLFVIFKGDMSFSKTAQDIWDGGALLVWFYMMVAVSFMQVLYSFTGKAYKEDKPLYLVYQAAYMNLLLRTVFGILYGMKITSLPINLPFTGNYGIVMDSLCLALLIYSAWENRRIRIARGEECEWFDIWDFDDEMMEDEEL